jgi:DNA-binding HxlR family transcriptional regulator
MLKRKIAGITSTMLASSLKELEDDGLVSRMQYLEMPVKVEYALTETSHNLMPILSQLAGWGSQIEKME